MTHRSKAKQEGLTVRVSDDNFTKEWKNFSKNFFRGFHKTLSHLYNKDTEIEKSSNMLTLGTAFILKCPNTCFEI